MNKKTGIFVFLIMVSAILFNVFSLGSLIEIVQAANAPTEEWKMSYGTLIEDETAYWVVQTSDGGYILAGSSYLGTLSPPYYDYDAILVKLDSNGKIEWDKIIGDDQQLDAIVTSCTVVQTSDGYFLAGTIGPAADRSFWLYKAHLDGTLNWYTVFEGPYDDQYDNEDDKCYCMIQTNDGGFVLGGQAGYGVDGPSSWLMKSSSSGSKSWSQTYSDLVAIHSVVETSDGGLAFGGSGGYPHYFVKTDSMGNKQWIRSVHFNVDSIVQTSDGGYALAGEGTGQESGDWFLVKTDSSGHWEWNQTYYAGTIDLTSMIQTSNGEYVMVGSGLGHHPMEPEDEEDWSLIKTDSNGVLEMSSNEWSFLFGSGITDDKAYCVIETSDGGLAVAGFLYKNAGLIKLSTLKAELTLDPGWSMISFSALPEDAAFSSIFSDVGFYQVLTWDGTSYSSPTVAEAGVGYWVLVLEETTVNIEDTEPVASYIRTLPAGWSMIGSICEESVNAGDVFPSFYQILTWDGTSYVSSTTIEPGKGYWALVLEPTTITVGG